MSVACRESNGSSHVPGYWHSEKSVEISRQDIVAYTFGNNHFDPRKPIFVDALNTKHQVTYGEAEATINSLAAGLKFHGLQRQDCVCLHSYNNVEYPLLWLGTIAAGGIVSGSNPGYTSQELVHHFKITDTKFVITHADCIAAVEEAITVCDIPKSRVFVLNPRYNTIARGFPSWTSLLKHGSDHCPTFNNLSIQASTLAVHATTSGTTGLPKAATLSHRYIVTQAELQAKLLERRAAVGAVTQLQCLPIFHSFACVLSIVLPLRLGITTYFLPRFKLDDYVSAVNINHITDSAVVPPIITALLRLPVIDRVKLLSIRYMICAGAPMNRVVQDNFAHILHPSATVAQCWGATELGWITSFGQEEKDNSGSVGRLLPNTCLKIVDDNGHIVTQEGVRGEARIKSDSVFLRYRNNDQANHDSHDEEGFYRTGDRVYIRDGKIFLESRIKDIMKVNGWQVSPDELEGVIRQLETLGIKDCAVLGHACTTDDGLEVVVPRAYVVKSPGCQLTSHDIKSYVAKKLVSYKRLSGGVFFVDRIPRSNTGKILRRLIKTTATIVTSDDHVTLSTKNCDLADSKVSYLLAIIALPLCFMLGPVGFVFLSALLRRRSYEID